MQPDLCSFSSQVSKNVRAPCSLSPCSLSPLLSLFKQRGALSAPVDKKAPSTSLAPLAIPPTGSYQICLIKTLKSCPALPPPPLFPPCCLSLPGILSKDGGRCSLSWLWGNSLPAPPLPETASDVPLKDGSQWVLLGSSSWRMLCAVYIFYIVFIKKYISPFFPRCGGDYLMI